MRSAGTVLLARSGAASRALRSAASGQRFWSCLTGLRLDEQSGDVNSERGGQAIQESDCRVLKLAFKAAHVRAIDIRISGELLLRQAGLYSNAAQIPCHQLPPIHGPSRSPGSLLNHGV